MYSDVAGGGAAGAAGSGAVLAQTGTGPLAVLGLGLMAVALLAGGFALFHLTPRRLRDPQ